MRLEVNCDNGLRFFMMSSRIYGNVGSPSTGHEPREVCHSCITLATDGKVAWFDHSTRIKTWNSQLYNNLIDNVRLILERGSIAGLHISPNK